MHTEVVFLLSVSIVALLAFYFSKYDITFTEEED